MTNTDKVDLAPSPPATPRGRVDVAKVAAHYRGILIAVGEDPDRDGLRGTPERVARWWQEFLDHDPGRTDATFEQDTSTGGEQLVVVRGIKVWSLCEHHLLPMHLDLSVGYLPRGRVLGLSKFARIAQDHAHRLQLQERIVSSVAEDVAKATGCPDIGVVADGEHLCMSMRGVRETQARTSSELLLGRLGTDGALRRRLLEIAGVAR